MSLAPSSSPQSRTIAAFFDTRLAAERAVADLQGAGVARTNISMVEGKSSGTAASAGTSESFLQSLKDMIMPDEDRYGYAEGLRRGGYFVSIKTDQSNHDRILDILDRDGAVDMDQRETTWRSEGWTGFQAPVAGIAAAGRASQTATDRTRVTAASAVAGQDEVIPLYEERLDVGKREVSHGRLRVRSYVVESAVEEQVSLRTESVQVDRRPVDREVKATDALFQDRTIELEEFAEEAVVSKQARVVEEISLRKEASERVESIHDTVRRTEVEVDDGRLVGTAKTGIASDFSARLVAGLEVVGSDGLHVGTVDRLDGTSIKLKKNDATADGRHHLIPLAMVASVGGKAVLNTTAKDAMSRWTAA